MIRIPTPHTHVKNHLRSCIYEEWENEWNQSKTANHARSFYARPDTSKAKRVYKLARLELGRFARIITGHNNLNFFQNKLGLSPTRSCRYCNTADETITHFLTACPVFVMQRRDVLLDKIPTADMQWSVRSLIDFSYIPGINLALEGTWALSDAPTVGNGLDEADEWTHGPGSDMSEDENNNTLTPAGPF